MVFSNNKFSKTSSSRGSSFRGGFGSRSNSSKPPFKNSFRGGNRSKRPIKELNVHFSQFIKEAEPKVVQDYVSKNSFDDFELDERLRAQIKARGYINPTPIQDQTIIHALEGRDILGLANTGTGKTAAFLIPTLHQTLQSKKNGKISRTLIIAPTRELAIQIDQELRQFLFDKSQIYSLVMVGGTDIVRDLRALKRPFDFYIGTPGRIMDLLNRKALDISECNNVVLDEVDRMLDMGFIDDIKTIFKFLPQKRQTLFFSASMDKKTKPLADSLLINPVSISIESGQGSSNIHQNILRVSRGGNKSDLIDQFIKENTPSKTLIFTRTKRAVDDLYEYLYKKGHNVDSLHGDKSLGSRRKALEKFKKGDVSILVATDVAARGLDVSDISHVINYDLPDTYETYIHRIGRTGRGKSVGWAYTIIEG
jgi:superfamily II DNA/RNA helicase